MGCFLLGLLVIAGFTGVVTGAGWLLIQFAEWVADKNNSYPIIGKVGTGLFYTVLAGIGIGFGFAAHDIGCNIRGHHTQHTTMSMNHQ